MCYYARDTTGKNKTCNQNRYNANDKKHRTGTYPENTKGISAALVHIEQVVNNAKRAFGIKTSLSIERNILIN